MVFLYIFLLWELTLLFLDLYASCRWTINREEPLLFLKFKNNFLNILDTEKKTFVWKTPIQVGSELGTQAKTCWIDTCPTNGNLLTMGGEEKKVKIFDRREAKIIKTFNKVHSGKNH